METSDTILSAPWIIPIEPAKQVLENHCLVIDKGKIIDLLPVTDAKTRYQTLDWQELPETVLMPGLVNTHTHAAMNLLRGLADDLPLMEWLYNHIWPAEKKLMNADTVKAGSLKAIQEMLASGITCFNDMYGYPLATADAAIESGIRATIGLTVMEFPAFEASSEQHFIELIHQYYQPNLHPRIDFSLAPHAPYTVSDHAFREIAQLSKEWGTKVHLHLCETTDETQQTLEKYHMRPIERMEKLGLINDRLIAVHMVDVNQDEVALLAKSGVSIAHCPESNLKLAAGTAPIAEYLQHGINVALGTDSAVSNNNLDMIGELRTASLLAKGLSKDPTLLPAHEALTMATLNGAKALGLDDKIGSLAIGKCADIIAIDLSQPFLQPIHNIFSTIAYTIDRTQVSHTWVDGKLVFKKHDE